jgi:glutamate N-acetyltransferase/amino-acid N-acetyltransferase
VSTTYPKGFRAAGVAAGLKSTGAADVALVVNDGPDDAAAAVFTTQPVPGRAGAVEPPGAVRRPGEGGRAELPAARTPAPGPEGFQDTHATAEHVAAELGIGAIDVAVAFHRPDRHPAAHGPAARRVSAAAAGLSAAGGPGRRAGDHDHRLGAPRRRSRPARAGPSAGMAKGAGHARAVAGHDAGRCLTTDAVVDAGALLSALKQATSVSLERVDSDGCLSTNDTVIVLANGASGVTPSPRRSPRR